MSVNAGIVRLVTIVLSLDEMLPLDHVMLDTIVLLARQARGKLLATLEHTVRGTTKNPNCALLEPFSLTTPGQVLVTVSTVLQVGLCSKVVVINYGGEQTSSFCILWVKQVGSNFFRSLEAGPWNRLLKEKVLLAKSLLYQ